MNDLASPDRSGPEGKPGEPLGRGLRVLFVISPPITKKDIVEIRKRLLGALSDSFASVELSYYRRDDTTTYLKILAERATFRLSPEDAREFYSRLLGQFLLLAQRELSSLNYTLVDIQVELLVRTHPPEKEGEFIPLLSPEVLASLIPSPEDLAREFSPPAPPSASEAEVPQTEPGELPVDPPDGEEKHSPVSMEVRTPEEDAYRLKALQASLEHRVQEGIGICLEGLEKFPESPSLLLLLANLVISQEKYTDALTILNHLVLSHSDFAEAYAERGRVRRRLNDEDGSRQDFVRARELDPSMVLLE